jgi:predicted nucleotidyltransferase
VHTKCRFDAEAFLYFVSMSSSLPVIARELGSDESTLRRAVARGTIRASRPSPRSLELPGGELAYLRRHWKHLEALKATLRTEPSVALAVLYGSMARGDDTPQSDFDLLVAFKDRRTTAAHLGARLSDAVGRYVDVAILSVVRKSAPFLLLQALDEGRVLIDRSNAWPSLKAQRQTIARAGRRQMQLEELAAAESIQELLGGI